MAVTRDPNARFTAEAIVRRMKDMMYENSYNQQISPRKISSEEDSSEEDFFIDDRIITDLEIGNSNRLADGLRSIPPLNIPAELSLSPKGAAGTHSLNGNIISIVPQRYTPPGSPRTTNIINSPQKKISPRNEILNNFKRRFQ